MTKNPMMNPFDDLFKQIADLLQIVQENVTKSREDTEVPPDVMEKLSKLRRDVQKFERIGNEFVEDWNRTKKDLKKKLPIEPILSSEDQERIRIANKLKADIETTSKNFKIPSQAPEMKVESQPEPKKEDDKKRRKKFKRMGGDDKWKPL